MSIIWQQPPTPLAARRGRPSTYTPIFAELQNRPGEWAKIAEGQANQSQVSRLRVTYPGAEITSRKTPQGTFDLFARYPMKNRRAGTRITGPIETTDRDDTLTLD